MPLFLEETPYQRHFKEMLRAEIGGGSLEGDPLASLSDEQKREFFTRVDASWRSKEEARRSGKKAGPTGKGEKERSEEDE